MTLDEHQAASKRPPVVFVHSLMRELIKSRPLVLVYVMKLIETH